MSIPSFSPSSAGRRYFYLLFVADKLSLIYKRHHKNDSEIMLMKIMSPIYLFNFIWILGLLHILLTGFQPYPHYISGEIQYSNISYILFACAIFSIFFIFCHIARVMQFWLKAPIKTALFSAIILVLQSFYSFLGAMHSPPMWSALIINNFILIILFFIIYPLYFKQNNRP